ncbi:MAG: hypothetical protein Athens101410_164, partial [Parcubacteria group bacterium Athens1014_10]
MVTKLVSAAICYFQSMLRQTAQNDFRRNSTT